MEKVGSSVKISRTKPGAAKSNAVLIGFFKENIKLSPEVKGIDDRYGNLISSYLKNNYFKAEKGEARNLYAGKDIKNIVLVGLGEESKYTLDIVGSVIADCAKKMRDSDIESYSILLSSFASSGMAENELAEQITIASLMGLYKFTEFKTKDRDKIKYVREINLITEKNFDKEVNYGMILADAINKTRNLINMPPNIASPEFVAEYARSLAKKSGLKCTIFDERHIMKMKMGCFMGVAQGSAFKPRLAVLEYKGSNAKPIILVGKGITFDTGGLNLKPYPYILNMKDDKGGAVASFHIIDAAAKLKLPVNLVVIAPLCENMPSSNSYRPDDVLTAYNGMTVEVKNTDAEGRMVLCDALAYAAKMKPQAIIDIATLTGASTIALGSVATPFLSTDDKLTERIKTASKKSLEKMWELPLWPEYDEQLKSDIADIKHISEEGEAGVIIGAAFLKNFVSDIPWAHIDIGTTVWSKVDRGILTKGATGATVRLMMEMLREWK